MEYLGMIITPGEVRMDLARFMRLEIGQPLKTLKEVRGFIGFANFYRRFIKDFASIARPLHDLTKKDVPWQWHAEQQHAFDTLSAIL